MYEVSRLRRDGAGEAGVSSMEMNRVQSLTSDCEVESGSGSAKASANTEYRGSAPGLWGSTEEVVVKLRRWV